MLESNCMNCMWKHNCDGSYFEDECGHFTPFDDCGEESLTEYEEYRAAWNAYVKDFN